VLAKIRAINRLVCVGETMRFALNSLATIVPDWLLEHSQEEWVDRYAHRFEEAYLPKAQQDRTTLAEQIGKDGRSLLTAIFAATAPDWLRHVPAVEILRRV
jgi:transposase